MTQIIIDSEMRDRLRQARTAVRLIDEEGHIVGTFTPTDVPPYGPEVVSPTPIAELKRRASESRGRTLEAILRGLHSAD